VSIIKSGQFIRFRKQSVLILRIIQNTVCRQNAVSSVIIYLPLSFKLLQEYTPVSFIFGVGFLHLKGVKINLGER